MRKTYGYLYIYKYIFKLAILNLHKSYALIDLDESFNGRKSSAIR